MDLTDLWAIRDDRTLGEHAKSAYVMLWLRQPDIHPSLPRLAADMGASESTARRGLKELAKAGLVEVTEIRNPTGGNAPNSYRLLPVNPGVTQTPPGVTRTPSPCPPDTPPGVTQTPEVNNLKTTTKTTSEVRDGLPAGSSRKRLDPTSERPWIVNHVQNAVLAVYGWDQALDLDHDRAVDLWVRFVADRSPADPVAYLSKIFADAESIDVLLSNAPFTEGGTVG